MNHIKGFKADNVAVLSYLNQTKKEISSKLIKIALPRAAMQ
jgi:hypothetical protein